MLSVAEIMSREPHTLGPDDSLHDAAHLMSEHHIRHIPIVNGEGAVVGLVSHRDVLAASGTKLFAPNATDEDRASAHVALSSIMASPVQTVAESEELRAVATLLHRQKIGSVPVLRDGRLVGIISDSDFLEVAMSLMEQLEMTEPEEDF